MRKPILAGNWKMYKTPAEAVEFVRELRPMVAKYDNVDIVVCVPFVALPGVSQALVGTKIGVGAQNIHWADKGAYTGEISAPMLKGLADYVIIGHSERREYFNDTDILINKKVHIAVAHGFTPIVCVGEDLEQNERGETESWIDAQVRAAFAEISAAQAEKLVVAYEPVWAIGTGKTATPEVANRVCGIVIRGTLADMYGEAVAQKIRIQYGGSATDKNIAELMSMPDIDGGLIGSASLKTDTFTEMIRITSGLY
jgi:triosephosphate isomerase